MKKAVLILACTITYFSYAQKLDTQNVEDLRKSPAGSKIILLLNFIASGEELNKDNQNDIFTDRLTNKLGTEGLSEIIMDIRINDGALILYSAERKSRFQYDLIVKSSQNDEWLLFKIYIKNDSPFSIDGFELNTIRLADPPQEILYMPKGAVEVKVEYTGFKNNSEEVSLNSELSEMANQNIFSGNVYVAKDWQPVYSQSVGLSDWNKNTKININTKFNIGSINKFFTAIAILQLLEEGKLRLNDPITKFITGFSDPRAKEVTIKDLLQHKSGWTMYWENEYYLDNRENLKTIDDYIKFLKKDKLAFDPGTNRRYSNTGFVMLGAVIERITDMSYFKYIQKNVFEKARMDNSGYRMDVDELAKGYTSTKGKNKSGDWEENSTTVGPVGNSAGGGYSTVKDLLSFIKALYNFKLVSKKSTILLLNDYLPGGKMTDLTLGGGGPGVMAIAEYDFENKITIIALSNIDPPSASRAISKVKEYIYSTI